MRSFIAFLFSLTLIPAAKAGPDVIKIVPHMIDGGLWKTTLKFVNLGTHTISLQVQFVGDDGNSVSFPLVANADVKTSKAVILTVQIAPGQTSTVETPGTASDLQSGWAVAVQIQTNCCPEPWGAMAIYTQHIPGGQDQEATVPLAGPITGNVSLFFDNTAYVTGIAIANQGDTVPLVAHIRDRTGKEIDSQTILIPKSSHVAFALPDLWKSTAGTEGSIVFSNAGQGISVFGLRFNGAAFTTFNTFPVAQ
jgi:hypothetical protein